MNIHLYLLSNYPHRTFVLLRLSLVGLPWRWMKGLSRRLPANWVLSSIASWSPFLLNGSIKHFDLEMTNGVPESARRLETRFIVRNNDGVYGATYRWNSNPTNATLVPEEGLDEPFVIHDGGTVYSAASIRRR